MTGTHPPEIYQDISEVVPQTGPTGARQQGFIAPSPSFPAGGAASGPNTPLSGSGFIPYAAQVNLTANQTWVGQIDAFTFWPHWNSTTYNASPTPGFDPDGLFNPACDFPPAAAPPGPPWPGFVIPASGIYKVYAYINLEALGESDFANALFNTFIEQVPVLFPTGAGTLFSDNGFSPFAVTGEQAFANCNVEGAFDCLAGDFIFCGIDDANSFGANNNCEVTTGSYFGLYRIR